MCFSDIRQFFCAADALPSAVLSDNLMKVDEIKKITNVIGGVDIEDEYDDEYEDEEESGPTSSSSLFSFKITSKHSCPCHSRSIKKSELPR